MVVEIVEVQWTVVVNFHQREVMVIRSSVLNFGFSRQVSEILVMNGRSLGKRLLLVFGGGI